VQHEKQVINAPEAVVLNLIRTKCLAILLYAVESCPLVIRDKRSLEFTVTRSLMKSFKTGSATVISDCQKFFGFLTDNLSNRYSYSVFARFLENDMISDYGICMLFERHAKIGRNQIFSTYGGDVHSVSDLRCAIDELFFC